MTTPTPHLLPLAPTGCGCCAPATQAAPIISATAPDAASASVMSYQVAGMTCGHCATSITDALQNLDQVDAVHIDLVTGGISTVSVTGAASPDAVRRVIEQAGYRVLHP